MSEPVLSLLVGLCFGLILGMTVAFTEVADSCRSVGEVHADGEWFFCQVSR